MLNLLKRFRNEYRRYFRKLYMRKQVKRLRNTNICMVASNCTGATILHDVGLQFKSPFVNLWIKPKDYIKMLKSLKEYMDVDLKFTQEDGIEYPVGLLKDVKLYFQHYKSEEEAKAKWKERVERMDYDNLFILFTDSDGCTEQDLIDFDNLPYKNKKVFVNRPHHNIKSAVYIKGLEDKDLVGRYLNYKGKCTYKKYYDDFDYVQWFNSSI